MSVADYTAPLLRRSEEPKDIAYGTSIGVVLVPATLTAPGTTNPPSAPTFAAPAALAAAGVALRRALRARPASCRASARRAAPWPRKK